MRKLRVVSSIPTLSLCLMGFLHVNRLSAWSAASTALKQGRRMSTIPSGRTLQTTDRLHRIHRPFSRLSFRALSSHKQQQDTATAKQQTFDQKLLHLRRQVDEAVALYRKNMASASADADQLQLRIARLGARAIGSHLLGR